MAAIKNQRFGELPPRYSFVFNPYPEESISRCPLCGGKTGQRKLPLLIHVDPAHLLALNYTSRYCRDCELLIAHRHEVERLLHNLFMQLDPDAIGNDYMVMGTLERKTWSEGMKRPNSIEKTLANTSDFKTYLQEIRFTRPGWYGPGQEPPVMEPPPSQDRVERGS